MILLTPLDSMTQGFVADIPHWHEPHHLITREIQTSVQPGPPSHHAKSKHLLGPPSHRVKSKHLFSQTTISLRKIQNHHLITRNPIQPFRDSHRVKSKHLFHQVHHLSARNSGPPSHHAKSKHLLGPPSHRVKSKHLFDQDHPRNPNIHSARTSHHAKFKHLFSQTTISLRKIQNHTA